MITKEGRVYIGSFVDNKKQGEGRLIYPDKSEYKGQFNNNCEDGKGVYIDLDKNETQVLAAKGVLSLVE